MAIAHAVQHGPSVWIYDERGRMIGSAPAYDGLAGYTSGTVSVRAGPSIYLYNEKGQKVGSVPAR